MALFKILKNFMTLSQRKRLEKESTKEILLENINDLLNKKNEDHINNLRICLAHNTFEKVAIKDLRKNLHDTYLSFDYNLESGKQAGHIIHLDQDSTLHLVKDGYIEYQKEMAEFDIAQIEDKTTKFIIDNAIKELTKITPQATFNNEDKSLEWLKVTLLTLKKSLDKIDHQTTIQSYKIYFGEWEENPILRFMIYNLDIKLAFSQNELLLEVRNKENRQDFDENAKLYQASFKQLHNEVLNEIINVFIKLKEVRNRPQ